MFKLYDTYAHNGFKNNTIVIFFTTKCYIVIELAKFLLFKVGKFLLLDIVIKMIMLLELESNYLD